MNKTNRTKNTFIILGNAISIVVFSMIFYFIWMNYYTSVVFYYRRGNWILLLVYILIYTFMSRLYGGFQSGNSRLFDIIYSQCIALLLTNFIAYLQICLIAYKFINVIGFLIIISLDLVIVILYNYVFNRILHSFFPPSKTLILYQTSDLGLIEKINRYQSENFNISATINLDKEKLFPDSFDMYDCLIITNVSNNFKEKIIKYCYKKTISLYLVPDISTIITWNARNVKLMDMPILMLNKFGPTQLDKIIKRVIDIFVSLLAIFVTFPIWIIVIIAIKLTDGGPVFYKQKRLSIYGKVFKIIKFRSMNVNAEKNGNAVFAQDNDQRITSVGKVIRRFRIDEIPQLINILVGDMSLVGPRPERPEIVREIIDELPEFNYRLKVKAGLTGYAQVYGKYNTSLLDKLKMDLMYIENYTLFMDIKLIFLTIKVLFMKDSTEGVTSIINNCKDEKEIQDIN